MLHLNKNPGIMKVDLGDGYFILIMDGESQGHPSTEFFVGHKDYGVLTLAVGVVPGFSDEEMLSLIEFNRERWISAYRMEVEDEDIE